MSNGANGFLPLGTLPRGPPCGFTFVNRTQQRVRGLLCKQQLHLQVGQQVSHTSCKCTRVTIYVYEHNNEFCKVCIKVFRVAIALKKSVFWTLDDATPRFLRPRYSWLDILCPRNFSKRLSRRRVYASCGTFVEVHFWLGGGFKMS